MRRLVILVLAIFLISATSLAAEKLLFEDDFQDGIDPAFWFPLSDAWDAYDGVLVFPTVSFGDILGGEEDWENYAVECEILPLEFGPYGSVRVFFRSNEVWYGYSASFHAGGFMIHRFEGNWDQHTIFANEAEPTFTAGVPFKVRIEVYRNTMKVFVDGELVFEGEDPDDMYYEGMFGFRADNSACEISNLKVYQL
ncbi:MAG: family 16 glycoside hydrolase [Bacillota bacterium]|nr:DUF6250 domain-containing protein [Bacillota bacterium]MDD4263742.1 DUF6250 domain-containing protein [Bacillota bacterium]